MNDFHRELFHEDESSHDSNPNYDSNPVVESRKKPAYKESQSENLASRQASEHYNFRERMGVLDEAEKETIQEGGKPIAQKEQSSFSLNQIVEIRELVNSLVEKRVAEELSKIMANGLDSEDFEPIEKTVYEMNDDIDHHYFRVKGDPELFMCVVARAYDENGELVPAGETFDESSMKLKPTWDWVRML